MRSALAMTIGCALFIGAGPSPVGNGRILFPINGTIATLADYGLIALLSLTLFSTLLWRSITVTSLFLGAFTIGSVWIARYSAAGAFVPHAAFCCLFFAAVLLDRQKIGKNAQNELQLASIFFALIFIIAGIQKINPDYLNGKEFTQPAGLFGFILHYFGKLPGWISIKALPPISIGLELIIGAGLLWKPQLFAHISIIFILLLSFLHPPVLFVYITLLPLFSVLNYEAFGPMRDTKFERILTNEYLWFFFIWALLMSFDLDLSQSTIRFFLRHWIVSFALFSFHLWLLYRTAHGSNRAVPISPLIPKHLLLRYRWTSSFLLFIVMTPLAFFLGAPLPIGYTMFSGRNGRVSHYILEIQNIATCRALANSSMFLSISDASLTQTVNGSCFISGPTISGINYVTKKICLNYPPQQSIDGFWFHQVNNSSWQYADCRNLSPFE